MTTVADWRCDQCGNTQLFAVKPGVEPQRRGAVDLFTRADPLIDRGEPLVFWCRDCWLRVFGTKAA